MGSSNWSFYHHRSSGSWKTYLRQDHTRTCPQERCLRFLDRYLHPGLRLVCNPTRQAVYSYVKNTININADTPQNVRRRMITVATRVGRIAWTYTAFLFILPTLFSFLVEFYLIVPLHTYFAIEERHVMHFVQSWPLGLLYVKLTTRIILWHEDSRPAQSLRAITRNGYLDPDARLATRSFILPVGLSLCFALAYPWACATLATM